MHIHISLPRRLRSGMRSIARRIESGPTRGRERPGANEGKSERMKRRASERDGGNEEIREEREKEIREERQDREKDTERKIARERERTRREETWRDEEARFARVEARPEWRKRKGREEVEELEEEEPSV